MIPIHRPTLIAVLGTSGSKDTAARRLGLSSRQKLNCRLLTERLTVRRVCPQGAQSFIVIEDRRP